MSSSLDCIALRVGQGEVGNSGGRIRGEATGAPVANLAACQGSGKAFLWRAMTGDAAAIEKELAPLFGELWRDGRRFFARRW